MPPIKPPQKSPQEPSRFYSSIMASLQRFKTFLDLLISDILRFILVVILFLAIVGVTLGAISYKQWWPAFTAYIQTLGAATSTSNAASPTPPSNATTTQ
jgi:hypothetical protein